MRCHLFASELLGFFLLVVVASATAQRAVSAPAVVGGIVCNDAKNNLTGPNRSNLTAFQALEQAKLHRACVETKRAQAVADAASAAGMGANGLALQMHAASLSQADVLEAQQLEAAAKVGADFMGMTFGVGVGFSQSRDRITEATLAADGTVRALAREKQSPRVILEAHYYGICKTEPCRLAKTGIGPFFGLAATNDNIDAFALGVMFGRKDPTADASGGFSVGIGAVLDREVKTLAKGFEEGKPPPAGETTVAFEKKSKWSRLLFFTRTF